MNVDVSAPGTKEKILIEILTRRSSAQRQLLCEAYKEATGRVRKQSSSGNFQNKSSCGCKTSTNTRVADRFLIGNIWFTFISTSVSTVAFQTLVEDLRGDTSGDLEELLVALATPPAAFDCHQVMKAMKVGPTHLTIHLHL